ncbi:MAG TPA: sigma factor-like helix-turn-helix DNA-binding protein [Acidimicrobiales bacterium]
MSDDEREVLSARLGLDQAGKPRTFGEVATMLGRELDDLRAVESSALRRLRVAD